MCAELLSLVVMQIRPSVHAAYRTRREQVGVSVQSLYQKLARIEPTVSAALVRDVARDLGAVIDRMGPALPGPLDGFDVRIVDGNYLQGTQHRLKELRCLGDAALPGHSLVVLNPHRELIEDVVLCRDGHANQKPLALQLLDQVAAGQCWIADRDFSTGDFLFGVRRRQACFLVRQHGALIGELLGRRRRLGRIDSGMVYEQPLRVTHSTGTQMTVRRITVELDQPTRNKDTQLHLLTNLPLKIRGQQVATAYRSRWNVETAFAKLTVVLRCELNTLGYPDAALFGFCLAVVMYNAISAVMAALRTAHHPALKKAAAKPHRKLSFYYVADEIAGVWRGMEIAVPECHWTAAFAKKPPKQLAEQLLWLARRTDLNRFWTNPHRPQQRRKRRLMTTPGGNISTHRLLQKRRRNTA